MCYPFKSWISFPSVFSSWIFPHDPMPLTEEQSQLAAKAASCAVLLLDKRHYPLTPAEGFWQWINVSGSSFHGASLVYQMWLIDILQIISRWATDASEFCFRKVLTKPDNRWVPWLSRPLGFTKPGYEENIFHVTLDSKYCEPCLWSHIDKPGKLQPAGHGHQQPRLQSNVDALSLVSGSKASATLFSGMLMPTWLKLARVCQGALQSELYWWLKLWFKKIRLQQIQIKILTASTEEATFIWSCIFHSSCRIHGHLQSGIAVHRI